MQSTQKKVISQAKASFANRKIKHTGLDREQQ